MPDRQSPGGKEGSSIEKRSRQFDPFGWLEAAVSPRWSHRLLRAGVIALLLVFLARRLGQYEEYFFKPLWAVETLVYVVFIVGYAIRTDPLSRSRGFKEILVPLAGAVLPFALLFTRPTPWIAHRSPCLYAVFSFMTLSTAFTTWGLWTLRRSFSITVEARDVVGTGPYRLVRHPIYLGEICTAAAVVIWRFSVLNVVMFALFLFIQLARAGWEEVKLGGALPAYRQYSRDAWWFGRNPRWCPPTGSVADRTRQGRERKDFPDPE